MKRMVLVPEQTLNRYEQRQRLETTPIMSNMLHKDTQMSDILERNDMGDDEKQKRFNADLERFMELRRQKNSQALGARMPATEEEHEPKLSDSVVVDSIPKSMQSRATSLLKWIRTNPDAITWDKAGQVKIEGKTIPGSNISDLVSDAMRSRKNFNPEGSREFFEALSRLNVPKDLVRNQERWRQVGDATTTPRAAPRSSERFRSIVESYEERDTPKRWQHY